MHRAADAIGKTSDKGRAETRHEEQQRKPSCPYRPAFAKRRENCPGFLRRMRKGGAGEHDRMDKQGNIGGHAEPMMPPVHMLQTAEERCQERLPQDQKETGEKQPATNPACDDPDLPSRAPVLGIGPEDETSHKGQRQNRNRVGGQVSHRVPAASINSGAAGSAAGGRKNRDRPRAGRAPSARLALA